ncbi:S-layer homology domain-containing protein [Paenibacillus sp. ov031]|uniref:beta strand repeat-containing protein n=1 Tax=Paenibacillus sp. ov031 TaxID=1761879 RepID=UPI00091B9D80|nr:S-layer homology domain-containing protein [Paenibacillus sp. ov031]SHN67244.1 S-layer homology domain-containing protein [Paenibacillus sp. ov031]
MRNTSDPIKENSNVMNAQGGEKKVMKKILSVALSTAMAFSMFASVAFGDTAVSPQQQFDALKAKGIFTGYPDGTAGLDKDMTRAEFAKVITKLLGLKEITGTLSYNDKNYTAKNWAVPYIEAVTAAGIMEGKNVEKKIFDFNGKVTVSEMATILTRALDLEIPTETNNNAADWAKGYVQAAINAGLIDAKANFSANASRELLVGAAYAIDQAQSLKVASYEVSEAGKVVTFKISDGESVKVTLDKALEANKETEVKFTYKDKEFTEKVTYVVTTATKVQSVTATNLKEVTVNFDGDVNKASAENVATYTIKDDADSNVSIKSAELQNGGKSVVLTLTNALLNQEDYKLSVNSLKGSDTTKLVTQKDIEFKPVDSVLPTVESVEGLGNKAIKVTFSEPVEANSSVASTFKLDGTAISGVISGSGSRELIIEVFSTLSVGKHTLTINDRVQDYVPYKLIEVSKDFEVVEDKTAPTVAEVKDVTLEGATVVFSEDVKDSEAIKGGNYYWLSGSTKHYANDTVEKINSKTFKLTFSGSAKLPAVATDLYVQNIVDFSSNVIAADTKVSINPVVDQTRPEVVSALYDETTYDRVKYTFTKPVDLTTFKTSNVVVKDKDGKVVTDYGVSILGGATGSTKEFTLVFSKALESGKYTVELSGLQDTTTLKNTMLPYTTSLEAKDAAAPGVTSVTGNANVYYVTFDKSMDTSSTASILNPDNYFVKYVRTNNATPVTGKLPAGTNITPVNDNKGVIITLPTNVASVSELTIQGVKSSAGVFLNGYSKTFGGTGNTPINADFEVVRANATAKDTVLVKFNQPVSSVNRGGFTVAGGITVTNAVVDSTDNTVVKLTLSNKISANAGEVLTFSANAAKNLVNAPLAGSTTPILDTIAPSVLKTASGKINLGTDIAFNSSNSELTINLDEAVKAKNTANFKDNFKVIKADGTTISYGSANDNYEVKNVGALTSATGDNKIVLDFSDVAYVGTVSVVFTNDNGNFVDASAFGTDGVAKTDLKLESFDTRDSDTATGTVSIAASTATAPVAPTVTSATRVKTANYAVTGVTSPNAVVTVSINGNAVAPVTANANGEYTTNVTLAANTSNTITVKATNSAGTTNGASATTVIHDDVAPTVTTKLPAANSFTANATQTLVFSEAIDTASQTAVKTAVDAAYSKTGTATVSSTWTSNTTLTVTISATDATNQVTLGTVADTAVTDLAGNTSTALELQN